MADKELTEEEKKRTQAVLTDNWAVKMTRRIVETAKKESPVQENPGDYYNEEGLLVCGKCHKQKQTLFRFLDHETIVPCVCDCQQAEIDHEKEMEREEKRMQRIRELRAESLMDGKINEANFDDYILTGDNKKAYKVAKRYVERFDEMYEDGQGLLFYGSVGTGKTFTAACIANALLNQGRSVLMTSIVRILESIKSFDGSEDRFLSVLKNTSLVILDDFGTERNTGYSEEKVYNVIDSRLNTGKPMILTTNLRLENFENGSTLGSQRIFDRILEACYPVEMNGKSMRKVIGGEKKKIAKSLLEN